MRTDVLIVGAGPTGLTFANILSRYGINFSIIDQEAGPTDQSRAAIVHVRTLEYWDKLGLAERAIEQGVKIKKVKIFTNGNYVTRLPLGESARLPTPYPFALAYPQNKTQRLLMSALNESQNFIQWRTQLLSLTQAFDEVHATVRCADGSREVIIASWVLGTDGSRSVVRQNLNVGFKGDTYEQVGFLADVEMDSTFEEEALHLNLSHGGFVGILPLSNTRQFRLFGAMTPRLAEKAKAHDSSKLALADMQEWFDQYFFVGHKLVRLNWTSVYRIQRGVVDTYRVGRCFLAGDAAHLHSPAGGQGMNLGIGDAFNLAWKLALVIKKQAYPQLLESYEAERRPIAVSILKGSDRGFELEVSKNPFMQLFTIHVLPLLINGAILLPVVRSLIFELFSQTWISYQRSPMVTDGQAEKRGPKAGERAPYSEFANKTQTHDLYALLKGTNHHLFLFEGQQALVTEEFIQELTHLLANYYVEIQLHHISREERALHRLYSAQHSAFFLIRPDGHIAYGGKVETLDILKRYLDRWFLHT